MPPPVPVPPPPHNGPPSSPPAPRPTRFAPYTQALNALSQRTRTPLPSLVLSFAVLHELTALVPLAGFFFGARALGVGDTLVKAISESQPDNDQRGWVREKGREWVDEGGRWAERVGRRYGVFGFEKRMPGGDSDQESTTRTSEMPSRLAEDAANAIVAYALTKALMPIRVGVSLYLSPAFSRRVVEPIRQTVLRTFRRQ
ncbi:hypothetical protein BXZ70DRAFT_741663 [Cristinia sonorae]|uniref:Uncharacterized protein n=1 Tax=Cristinia sonorae TaxID=1940300 RepID=A0A8K0UUT8_9AGAR|nr:hypothetical protein BXZ70DRAFT_741663 [Cristinia sonorae]